MVFHWAAQGIRFIVGSSGPPKIDSVSSATRPMRPRNVLSATDIGVPSSRGDLQLSESLLDAARATQQELRKESSLQQDDHDGQHIDGDGANGDGRSATRRVIERIRGRREKDIVELEPKLWR